MRKIGIYPPAARFVVAAAAVGIPLASATYLVTHDRTADAAHRISEQRRGAVKDESHPALALAAAPETWMF